jgi:hypothetical protein
MSYIKLSEIDKDMKFKLAHVAGYKVEEDKENNRCKIVGADNYIDNNFRNIDEVLLLIRSDLKRKGFIVAA